MFTDDQDAVDREPVAAECEGLGDRGIDLQPRVALLTFPAEVARGPLIDVERNEDRKSVV